MSKLSLEEMKRVVIGTLVANGLPEERAESLDGYNMEEYFCEDPEYKEFEGYIIREEESFGGYEGDGDSIWKVFKVTKDDEVQYFRTSGYYDSWNGTEWERSIELVDPHEVTVIKWAGAKNI